MLKLGFNIVADTNSLWVCILKSKYGVKEGIPDSLARSRESYLWKSLSKIGPLLQDNIFWSVGDGLRVKCWKDNWILEIRP